MTRVITKVVDDIVEYHKLIAKKSDVEAIVFFRPGNVRLSFTGYKLLKKIYTEHKFPIQSLTNQHLVQLYRVSNYPYYLSGKYLCIFDGEEAFAIKLIGDVKDWLENAGS